LVEIARIEEEESLQEEIIAQIRVSKEKSKVILSNGNLQKQEPVKSIINTG